MKIKNSIAVVTLTVFAILGFSGCATSAVSTPDPVASAAAAPVTETEPTPPPVNNFVKGFGEVITYEDGLSISVSVPAEFLPTEYASGADQTHQVVFNFVLTNGSTQPFEPMAYPTISSGGVEATKILDFDNAAGDINFSPSTAILPGQTISWVEAYSISDPANITVDIAPSFAYDTAIFTNVPF